MSKQAKVLSATELRRVLDYVSTRPHAARNRAMLLMTFYAGLRVKEVAMLCYQDVLDADGQIKNEFYLSADQTKGSRTGTVLVSDKLRRELTQYVRQHPPQSLSDRLFHTQKRSAQGFTANTLTQHFHHLYRRAGITGASSHSGRRTFITTLADKGVAVRVLMSLARHANISTTQAYIDVNAALQRRAVELV